MKCNDCKKSLYEELAIFSPGGREHGRIKQVITHYEFDGKKYCHECMSKEFNERIIADLDL